MENLVACRNSQQEEIHGSVVRLDYHSVSFEIPGPYLPLRTSEVLTEFRVTFDGQPVYFGKAVARSVVSTGLTTVCEATFEDSWMQSESAPWRVQEGGAEAAFGRFLSDWQQYYAVLPEFKAVVSDMQSFFQGLQNWFARVELGIRSSPPSEQRKLELEVLEATTPVISRSIDSIWSGFSSVAAQINEEKLPLHRAHLRRQLHHHILASPFAYRAFVKPLGYAGDYEMVNMIFRSPFEGESLFAKAVNHWLLQQPPSQAHRNRIVFLTQRLGEETARAACTKRTGRVLSLGCGPAVEVQQFVANNPISDCADFTLLDFNDETLAYTSRVLGDLCRVNRRQATVRCEKRSVQQIVKQAGKISNPATEGYDFIYCAGLFDYLYDQICKRLISIFYSWLAPGGLLVTTNVNAGKSYQHSLDFILDWHLIYRTADHFRRLLPDDCPPGDATVNTDDTGTNLFMEIRKPSHA